MKVQLKNVRLSYANIFHAVPPFDNPDGDKKFNVALLWPKGDPNTDKLKEAIMAEIEKDGGKKLSGNPKKIDKGLRNGDEKFTNEDETEIMEGYAGQYYISAKAQESRPPVIVDGHKRPITDESKVYSGCYCNVFVETFAYATGGNKGVGFGLLGIQFVKDGEPLGSTFSADLFDEFDTGDEDDSQDWDDANDTDDDGDDWD